MILRPLTHFGPVAPCADGVGDVDTGGDVDAGVADGCVGCDVDGDAEANERSEASLKL